VAHRFQDLLAEINAPLTVNEDSVLIKHAQQRRRDSVAVFESCIQEMRDTPGYGRFLVGLTPNEMRACAVEGPIIVVNITDLGAHATIVLSSEIKSIELPNLLPSEARKWLNRQWNTDRENLQDSNQEFQQY
jgi:hypothetical protein